ncbi:GtrA family protein [Lapidilactobacillus achengensis]|uniref:GtrA family protein n=1 Tax=Lapidilactobacillus achengensis TaxID=2486000 RepID=A0ABW1UP54_9LACO|nr:GtrA family protein [Lapidilactobacillus achengensis]
MKKENLITRLLKIKIVQQFIKFGLVGALNTLLTLAIYYLTYRQIGPSLANGLGFLLTSILGIYLNFKFVFKAEHFSAWTLFKYYATYGVSMLISMYVPHLWVNVWGLDARIAPLISLLITIPFNFVFMRLWVFPSKKTTVAAETSQKSQQPKN